MKVVLPNTSVTDAVLASLAPAQVLSIADSNARVNLWTGSVRSGKTIASLLRWCLFVAAAPRGGELAVIGRTRDSIARNVFGPLQDPDLFGSISRFISYTPGAPTARMFGRVIHVIGASDAKAEKVLRGLTLAGAYVDEATLVDETFWNQLLARLSVPGAKLFATTNPDGPGHWLKKQVLDRAAELGYRIFRFRLTDNTHLDHEYVAQICREYVGLWYKRFILGEWVQAEGAIYSMWDPDRHVITADELPRMTKVLAAGVDYGDTHATRGYLIGMGPDTRPGYGGEQRLYVLSEWAPGEGTQPERSKAFRAWLAGQEEPEWRVPRWVPVDSAAKSFKNQLFHDGVPGVRNSHKSVLPGIRTVSGLLATGKMVVVDTCTELIDRIPGYVWDPKATARGEDAPKKENDDEVDALRYGVYTTRSDWLHDVPLAPAAIGAPGDDEED